MDLGTALHQDDLLTPRFEVHDEYCGLIWNWSKPDDGEWANYEFCAAFAANSWRVPHEGGYMVHINFMRTDDVSWSYLIGGRNSGDFTPISSLWGNLDIGEMVWYLLIRRDEKQQALDRGLGGVFAGF
jgi:hypothetical protein